jgi:hypothetical protein
MPSKFSKSANMSKTKLFTKFKIDVKNAEFYADFESVRFVSKKLLAKK